MGAGSTLHKITATRHGHANGMDWDAQYEITFRYTPGQPARHLPPILAFVSVTHVEGDADATRRYIEDWASDWLEENWERALGVARKEQV